MSTNAFVSETQVKRCASHSTGPDTNGGLDKCVQVSGELWDSRDCAARYSFMCKVHQSKDPFTTAYPPTQPVESLPCDPTSPKDHWYSDPSDPNREFCYFYGR